MPEKGYKLDNYMTHNKRPGNVQLPGILHNGSAKPQKGEKKSPLESSPCKNCGSGAKFKTYSPNKQFDVGMDDMGMEDEMPAEEEGAMDEAGKEELLAQVVQAVADTLGVEAEVEGAGEEMAPEGEEEMDFVPADEEVPAEEAPEEEEEMMMESDEVVEENEEVVEGVEVMDEDTIVQETVKRVTARLKTMKEAKKKEDLVESVASRIMARLSKK